MFTTLAFLQNMGVFEWGVILIIALLIFGHKLPSLARSMGSSVNEFKKGVKEGEDEVAKPAAPASTATPPAAEKK
jgi:sec-independent protein translocase protein TatA